MKIQLFLILCFVIFCFSCNFQQNETSNLLSNIEEPKENIELPNTTLLTEKDIKRRDEIQKAMLKGENLHDGSIELQHIGDINSVPALLIVLKKNPPSSKGIMVCTTAHAIQALIKITKTNAGTKYEDWNTWWTRYQETQKSEAK